MPQWYYAQAGVQQGPVDLEQLRAHVAAGRVRPADLVWTEGMATWRPLSEVPELAPAAPPYAAPAPAYLQPAATEGPPLGVSSQGAYLPYAPVAQRSQHAGLATAAMVLGILSFFAGTVLTGIAALVCGWIALAGMKRTGKYQNKGQAIAGVVIGLFWVVALVIIIVALFVLSANK